MSFGKRRSPLCRRLGLRATAGVAALTAVLLGLPVTSPVVANAEPQPRNVDPFYQPPDGFEATEPGAILRSRPMQLPLPVSAQSWQLLYRTTDVNGKPEATVTTVILPDNAPPNRSLMSYQVAQDSSGPTCMPSYVLQTPHPPTDLDLVAQQIPKLVRFLQEGWVVSVPDFEGPEGHFGAAKEPGYMTLDGVRAAEHFAPLGIGPHTRVAASGYSGGGSATGWMAQTMPEYAPELNFVGAALGAPVPDPHQAILANNGGMFSGLIATGLASLAQTYPDFNAEITSHMTPEGLALLDPIRAACLNSSALKFMFTNWNRYFDMPIDQLLSLPEAKLVMDAVALGANAPAIPMLVMQSEPDEISLVATANRMVERYCAGGTPVTYVREAVGDHLLTGLASADTEVAWLRSRLNTDAPAPVGCTTRNVISQLLPGG